MKFVIEVDADDLEELFNRHIVDAPEAPKTKGKMLVLKKVPPNGVRVINRCKVALVREFGQDKASDYIGYMELTDERGIQYWLRYQIETSAYPETYSLVEDAKRWFAAQEQEG